MGIDFVNVERSSLHRALDEGRYQSVAYQLRLGMDPNVRSRHGQTPLMRCARVKPPGVGLQLIRILLERGANPDLTDARGNNLLQLAVKEDNQALVRVLLTENNVNFHHRDAEGNTVLHLLAEQSPQLCRLVLQSARRFHIDCDVANADGLTPMMAACRAGNQPVADLFASLGGASFTKRDSRWRRTAQEWLKSAAVATPSAVRQQGVRPETAVEEDPYEQLRHSRRVETLRRLILSRQQQSTQVENNKDSSASAVTEQDQQQQQEQQDQQQQRQATAAPSSRASSGGRRSRQMLAALGRSRTTCDVESHARLLAGIFGEYQHQLSASYRRPAVPLLTSAMSMLSTGGVGGDDNSRSGSRPLSRVSSGGGGGGGPGGGGLARRMTEVAGAGLRMRQRVRSGFRRSDSGVSAGSDSQQQQQLLLNTSQDSGGLRRLLAAKT